MIATTSITNVQSWTSEIYIVELSTNIIRSIEKTDYGNLEAQSWSPDGKSIAFVSQRGGDWPEGIWVTDLNGVHRKQFITEGYDVAWSPDGKSMAVFSTTIEDGDETRTLSILDLTTMSKRVIFSGMGKYSTAIGLTWSPDGTKLMFSFGKQEYDVSPRFPNIDVYVIDISTGESVIITNKDVNLDPTWSPAGKLIAYIRNTAGHFDPKLTISNVDGSCPQQITNIAWSTDWSPDGRKIAFENGGNIYVMALSEFLGYDLLEKGLLCSDVEK
jgi:Tol biopolymer transport system component